MFYNIFGEEKNLVVQLLWYGVVYFVLTLKELVRYV